MPIPHVKGLIIPCESTLVGGSSTSNPSTTRKFLSQVGNGSAVTDTSWQIPAVGGGGARFAEYTLFRSVAETAIAKVSPTETLSLLSNWGTAFAVLGAQAIVTMDGFTTVRLVVYAGNTSAQTGTVTVELHDGITSLVSLTFSDSTPQVRASTASIGATGQKVIVCRVKSTSGTDDPRFGYVGIELS